MAAALLLLLLLLPPPPLRAMTSPPPAPPTPPAPPFRNLRVDPALRRLSWERPRPGPRAACAKDGRSPVWAEPGRQHCVFPSLSRCHVTNLTVFAPGRGGAAWVLFPASDPNRAAAAADLRCWLHRVSRLSCRWGRGPGAPDDVQYRMFWRDAARIRATLLPPVPRPKAPVGVAAADPAPPWAEPPEDCEVTRVTDVE
ncbi:Il3ra [Phodopus roborovskii]|uniref:Il3ra protein n=1 Tax=Phodopus roborovskii TaxID=109678 RepID=A0AAU9YXP8_PHORO|nr:Il3ra [Phodopus roborovskii]